MTEKKKAVSKKPISKKKSIKLEEADKKPEIYEREIRPIGDDAILRNNLLGLLKIRGLYATIEKFEEEYRHSQGEKGTEYFYTMTIDMFKDELKDQIERHVNNLAKVIKKEYPSYFR
jgi:hypothetical protein